MHIYGEIDDICMDIYAHIYTSIGKHSSSMSYDIEYIDYFADEFIWNERCISIIT